MTHFLRSTACFSFTDNRRRKKNDNGRNIKDGDDEDDGGGDGNRDDEDGDCHSAAGVGEEGRWCRPIPN